MGPYDTGRFVDIPVEDVAAVKAVGDAARIVERMRDDLNGSGRGNRRGDRWALKWCAHLTCTDAPAHPGVRTSWCAQSVRSFVILDAWMCTCAQAAR